MIHIPISNLLVPLEVKMEQTNKHQKEESIVGQHEFLGQLSNHHRKRMSKVEDQKSSVGKHLDVEMFPEAMNLPLSKHY